jgi:hypothetical protein
MSAKVSLICDCCVLRSCMRKRSDVLSKLSFHFMYIASIAPSIVFNVF